MSHLSKSLLIYCMVLFCQSAISSPELISEFPLAHYNQDIATWIKPTDADYNKPLLNTTMQQERRVEFYDHLFGSLSPWNSEYLISIFQQSAPNDLQTVEESIVKSFNDQTAAADEVGYGTNYIPYSTNWFQTIAENINLSQFKHLVYQAKNRAIAIDNISARALPTDDPYFYNFRLPGEGYPFDNLQVSSIWIGTPLYVLGETRDHAWSLVFTPDFVGWVKSTGIARVSYSFVNQWQTAAKKNLAAITQTRTSITDEKKRFLNYAYIGTVLPVERKFFSNKILYPVADSEQHAFIKYVRINHNNMTSLPLPATPHQFANIMSSLVGRPYGWGNMYFYNDCSAELKNLFTPFGIWLPRHSSQEIYAGKVVDMDASTPQERLTYLMTNGQKLLTLIYIGGHIVLYIGNTENPNDPQHSQMAMTYQDNWGLSPKPAVRRSVIGKAVFLPMLLSFPEDTELNSQAAKKHFQIAFLNQMPAKNTEPVNFRTLMSPKE